MFSPWGLFTAIRAASAHLPHAELRQLLDERSGLAGLRDLICHHFGERAGTVRVRDAVADLALLTRRLRLRLPESSAEHAVLCGVGRDLEAFEQSQVTSFWQIDVLGEFYRGELSLDPGEVEDLLRLTGERGGGLPARLGVPVGGSQRDLREAAAAASRRWSAAARDGRNRSAAEKMTRVCDALQYAVRSGAAGETSRRDRVQPAMQGPVQRRARRERE
jgi:hypothetical protein